MSAKQDFWSKVQRKKTLFFVWWIAWLPIGLIGIALLKHFLGDSGFYGFGLLAVWFVGWQLILARLKGLRCPRCGEQAIAHPYFLLKNARCKNCGLRRTKQ